MIVIITTPGHGYTFKSFTDGTYGFPLPEFSVVGYEEMLRARKVRRATYVFADLERLSAWELRLAADLYRVLCAAGLRCLNNPAYAMSRVELLRTLHAAGKNPFQVWRADERPQPERFPLFVRNEADHGPPLLDPVADREQLERTLDAIQAKGIPLRGTILLEICTEPYRPGLWHKWGTFRVGERMSVDHMAIDDNWFVKYGDHAKMTEESIRDENDAVATNRFADELRPIFDLARIEFGRADHAHVRGRLAVYEINTNPSVGYFSPSANPVRRETQGIARRRLSACFAEVDTPADGMVELPSTDLLDKTRILPPNFMTPRP